MNKAEVIEQINEFFLGNTPDTLKECLDTLEDEYSYSVDLSNWDSVKVIQYKEKEIDDIANATFDFVTNEIDIPKCTEYEEAGLVYYFVYTGNKYKVLKNIYFTKQNNSYKKEYTGELKASSNFDDISNLINLLYNSTETDCLGSLLKTLEKMMVSFGEDIVLNKEEYSDTLELKNILYNIGKTLYIKRENNTWKISIKFDSDVNYYKALTYNQYANKI